MKWRNQASVLMVVSMCSFAWADPSSDYVATKKQVETEYKVALQACKQEPKSVRKTCDTRAKNEMTSALKEAKAQLDAAKKCAECGSVVDVIERDVQGEGSGVGVVAGAVGGGLLGKQIGKGKGKTAATIAGALVGGLCWQRGRKGDS